MSERRGIDMTSDTQLIEMIATLWVNNGGDAEGLDWVYSRLKKRIQELFNESL